MNNPIPSNLKSEAKKAAKILREFTEITSRNGPDKIIPAHVIAKAKGLAVLSVIKAGFLVTARGGSGVVLARLPDGKWSAPSAIGIAGLGGGFEIGIENHFHTIAVGDAVSAFTVDKTTQLHASSSKREPVVRRLEGTVAWNLSTCVVSDLVIILNYDRAVEAFAKGGNLTLGGNFTVAVGPLGRNLEGDISLRSSAAVFTYCKSRGLFAGISLEGSCLIERKETNRKFYCQEIRAYDILFGDIPRPAQAEDLYEVLDSFTEKYENEGQRINMRKAEREQRKAAAKELPPKPLSRPQTSSAQVQLNSGSQSNRNEYKLYPELSSYHEKVGNLNQPIEVTALYSFEGQQPGDLNFQAGDKITVISKTDSHFDWWEGKLRGQTGIFPANYVTMN
ncbi:SH3 domain-containing YSC84-like protein 1 isoform X4 [Equus asinus]|uniref:SH3 domain-containing YSC84-like protein 1 isoform X4 n=1 Tax=Equus asinus TaxID=9793 RepID=UPI001D039211|nr:SH3 domain-containing YSC84-like protein 1 isoform X5 [Equus asinus]XP_044627784.1 SH3 domain-containing YSC84-like protein 1 isoform X6 [Equus asinus]